MGEAIDERGAFLMGGIGSSRGHLGGDHLEVLSGCGLEAVASDPTPSPEARGGRLESHKLSRQCIVDSVDARRLPVVSPE